MAVREPPREKRTDISCCRCVARASSSAMMFVQAIRRRRETEPYKIQRDLRTPPMVISLSGSIPTLKSASVFGNAMPSCFCTVARFARACSSVTPGLSRPIPRYHVHSLLCAIGSSTGTEDQRSTSRSGNKKDTGIMPTMEEECPLTRSFFPRAFGSALKRRRQRRSLIRTALGPPKCSSSEVKSRPSAGAIPQTCKNRDAT